MKVKLVACGPGLNQQAQLGHACTSRPSWARFALQDTADVSLPVNLRIPAPKAAAFRPFLSWRPGEARQAVLYQLVVGPGSLPKHIRSPRIKVTRECRVLPVP